LFSFFKPIELGINSSCFNIKRYKKVNANICWSFYKKRKKIIIKLYPYGFIIEKEKPKIHIIKEMFEGTRILMKLIMEKYSKGLN